MSKYNDIGDAFGRYCETAWRLAGDARAVAQHLVTRIQARGEIPAGFLKLCPPGAARLDPNLDWRVEEAVRHEGGEAWAIGFLLRVRRGNDCWPYEFLRFDVILRMAEEYRVQLNDSQVMSAFAPVESAETHRILDESSQAVLDEIFRFYDRHPDRLKNGEPVIRGFSQMRQ